jgi:outer membrane protein TolC
MIQLTLTTPKTLSVAVALLTMISCVGKGTLEMAADAVVVPARWQQRSTSTKPLEVALWWRQFRDPVLNELISEALKASPTVRSALEKVTEYRARRGVESANLFPSLVANQSGRGAQTKSGITDVITTSESYKASFDVS